MQEKKNQIRIKVSAMGREMTYKCEMSLRMGEGKGETTDRCLSFSVLLHACPTGVTENKTRFLPAGKDMCDAYKQLTTKGDACLLAMKATDSKCHEDGGRMFPSI